MLKTQFQKRFNELMDGFGVILGQKDGSSGWQR